MSRPARILVVGAGPTGLALALQAHAHGASVRIIERRPGLFRPSRALILHPRTLEVLRPLGVTEQLLARADTAPQAELHARSRIVPVRLDELALHDTAFPHLSFLRQADAEAVLCEALADRGIDVEWGTELINVEDGPYQARAVLESEGSIERSHWDFVAGCDGPESTVRASTGVTWQGGSYAQEVVLADLELEALLTGGVGHVAVGSHGLLFLFPLGEQATWRLLATRPAGADRLHFGQPGPPVPPNELQGLLHAHGVDARIADLKWSARYALQHRLAAQFRRGRLFLVGDAAHAHSPALGQGMNAGIQDAINLGWKLAFAPTALDRAALLDSYELERRPVARTVLAMTHLAFWAEASTNRIPTLMRGALMPIVAPLVPTLLARRRLVAEAIRLISQLRVSYTRSPISEEGKPPRRSGPSAGRRLPDATVTRDGQRVRLHSLTARPGIHILLDRDAWPLESLPWGPRVAMHRLTNISGTGMVAVRPDGYIGFRSGGANVTALRTWLTRIGAIEMPDATYAFGEQPSAAV